MGDLILGKPILSPLRLPVPPSRHVVPQCLFYRYLPLNILHFALPTGMTSRQFGHRHSLRHSQFVARFLDVIRSRVGITEHYLNCTMSHQLCDSANIHTRHFEPIFEAF